ncbi:MAG: outer membrane protein assembly factor BamD [Betaproteobacteria bacterium]|nr:outer membrane protein assembly factor BamD [Betaproteobacteria bacterium]
MLAAVHRRSVRAIRYLSLLVFSAAVVLALQGCGSTSLARDETLGWSADKLYAEAKEDIASGNWAAALKLLEKLESRYPFGRHAQQAQIDTAFVHWKEGENALALAAIDRFTKLYPNHERIDYVLYLKGLVNFNDRSNLLARFTGEDLSERDPKAAREAFDSFKELITRFPNSPYAADASGRLTFLVNMLASSDVHVARFYYRRGATLAAVNRAQAVVKQYQEAPAIEEALAIMMNGYEQLGLPELSADARRVLQKNFPASAYLKAPYDPTTKKPVAAHEPAARSVLSRFKFW